MSNTIQGKRADLITFDDVPDTDPVHNVNFPVKDMYTTRKGVLLDAKRAFNAGQLMLSVYAFTDSKSTYAFGSGQVRQERIILMRMYAPKTTPKDEWRLLLRNMVMMTVSQRGIEQWHLRSSI